MKKQSEQTQPDPPPADPAPEDSSPEEGRLELLLEEVIAPEPPEIVPDRIDGIVVGRLHGFDPGGAPLVQVGRGHAPVAARALTPVGPDDVGREAALMFERGDPRQPIIMGLVQKLAVAQPAPAPVPEPEEAAEEDAKEDEERIVLSAKKDIVLQCGKAKITLTRAGKIIIAGAYVVTRSSGVNRILGGTVQIN